jgi:hypothetical protein
LRAISESGEKMPEHRTFFIHMIFVSRTGCNKM